MTSRRFHEAVTEEVAEAFKVQRPFPYQIFFRLEGQYIRVYAVLHGARDPATWRRRLP